MYIMLFQFVGNHHPPLADAEQRYQIAIDLFQVNSITGFSVEITY